MDSYRESSPRRAWSLIAFSSGFVCLGRMAEYGMLTLARTWLPVRGGDFGRGSPDRWFVFSGTRGSGSGGILLQPQIALLSPSFGTRLALGVTYCWRTVRPLQQRLSTGIGRGYPLGFWYSSGVVCGVVLSLDGQWCFSGWLLTAGLRWALGFSLEVGLQIARGAGTSRRRRDTTCGTAHWLSKSGGDYFGWSGLSGLLGARWLGVSFRDQPLGTSWWRTGWLFVADIRVWSGLRPPTSLPVSAGRIAT